MLPQKLTSHPYTVYVHTHTHTLALGLPVEPLVYRMKSGSSASHHSGSHSSPAFCMSSCHHKSTPSFQEICRGKKIGMGNEELWTDQAGGKIHPYLAPGEARAGVADGGPEREEGPREGEMGQGEQKQNRRLPGYSQHPASELLSPGLRWRRPPWLVPSRSSIPSLNVTFLERFNLNSIW